MQGFLQRGHGSVPQRDSGGQWALHCGHGSIALRFCFGGRGGGGVTKHPALWPWIHSAKVFWGGGGGGGGNVFMRMGTQQQ